jgi:adenylate cyclase
VPGLFVVARDSALIYKNKPERVQQIGRELGVRYILEGSARKADGQVRITAQLVDASTGYHVWADHYDKPLNDIFKVQDQIREKIVFALKVKLSPEEQKRFKYFPTNNMDAYDLLMHSGPKILSYTKENNREARQLCQQASELDQPYSAAYMCLAATYVIEWMWGWDTDPQVPERAFVLAQQAVALDDSSPAAHSVLGDAYKIKGQLQPAIREAQKSIELAPSCSS